MAYTPILDGETDVGDAIRKELIDKIVNNIADHELRINSGEAGASRVQIFNDDIYNSVNATSITGLSKHEALFPFTLTGCEIRIYEKGVLTGFLEVDIKKSTTNLAEASFTTVFTTKPKIDFASAVDYARSTNQVFNGAQISVNTGDTLRLDVTQLPTNGVIGNFRVILYGEV